MDKKAYEKPQVICQRDIEALTCVCEGAGNNTMQDKLDANAGMCGCPMT